MGVWGSGNFDEDMAEEHLAEVPRPLLQQIEEAAGDAGDPSAMEPDEYGGAAMLCNMEIIACLAEHLGKGCRTCQTEDTYR
jgi:hypothetical protein